MATVDQGPTQPYPVGGVLPGTGIPGANAGIAVKSSGVPVGPALTAQIAGLAPTDIFGLCSGLNFSPDFDVELDADGVSAFVRLLNPSVPIVATPIVIDPTTATLIHGAYSSPATVGLPAGDYIFRLAFSDSTSTYWSNLADFAFTVPAGLDGTDVWAVEWTTVGPPLPVGMLVYAWVSFNSETFEHVT